MLEIFLYCVVVGFIAKVASVENRSAVLWGAAAAGICVATLFIPLVLLRVLIAAVICILAMTAAKILLRQ